MTEKGTKKSDLTIKILEDGTHAGEFGKFFYEDLTVSIDDNIDPINPDNYLTNMRLIGRNGRKIWRNPKVLFNQKGHNSQIAGVTTGHGCLHMVQKKRFYIQLYESLD